MGGPLPWLLCTKHRHGAGWGHRAETSIQRRSGQEALSRVRGRAGGSRSGILGKGHFTGTDMSKGFLREATAEGMEACGEGKLQVLG